MKLIAGYNLTQAQREQVLRRYTNRYTGEHVPTWADTNKFQPTHQTDIEWVNDHAFYIRKDGKLSNLHKHCEPVYLAQGE